MHQHSHSSRQADLSSIGSSTHEINDSWTSPGVCWNLWMKMKHSKRQRHHRQKWTSTLEKKRRHELQDWTPVPLLGICGKTENTRADLLQPSLRETQRSSHCQIDPSDNHRILERDHAQREHEKGVKQRLRVYPCVLPPGQTLCFLRGATLCSMREGEGGRRVRPFAIQ